LTVALCSCSSTGPNQEASLPRFHGAAQADLVVEFPSWEAINIIKPNTSEGAFMPFYNRAGVQRRLAQFQTRRNLAVVVCSVPYSPAEQAQQWAAWNSILRGLGYHRVVYLLGPAAPDLNRVPILKDELLSSVAESDH
jgi:hypothetical protein